MKSEIKLAAKIESVTLDVKEIDAIVHRTVAIKFARDFDDTIAAALGGDAKQILASLRRHGQEKAYIAIDRMIVKATLVNPDGEVLEIASMHGKQAVCTASTSEQDPPTIRLEFGCYYADDIFAFLGRNAKGVIEISMAPKQGSLELGKKEATQNGQGHDESTGSSGGAEGERVLSGAGRTGKTSAGAGGDGGSVHAPATARAR